MKNNSITLLQIIITLIGLVALAMLIYLPLTEGRADNLDLISVYRDPFILYVYAASIFFFVALYSIFKLLGYIKQNKTYSTISLKEVKRIKYCAIILGVLIVLGGIYIRLYHNANDDPAGFLGLCILTTLVAIVVAVLSAKLEKKIRSEIATIID